MDANMVESRKHAKIVVFRKKRLASERLAFTARQNGAVEYAPLTFSVYINAKSTLVLNAGVGVFAFIVR